MTIELPESELAKIFAHARETYPEECCGFLIGHFGSPHRITEARHATNVRTDNRQTRYTIEPRETLRLERELHGTGRETIGFYHSHPEHPASPSLFDADHAWPGYAYVIVSVHEGDPQDVRAWFLVESETERSFREDRIERV